MKIKTKSLPYAKAVQLPRPKHKSPLKPNPLLQTLVRVLSIPELMGTHFTYTTERMDEAGDGPYLVLMNHSSFIDLKIAFKILYPKPFSIVCTSDGFVGKSMLMRHLGCIPTNKFVHDIRLIRDMRHALHHNHTSVLMYPEASYSFDGCATPLPRQLGKLMKMLDVPVVGIRTYGAFTRDPLYNCLQKRKVDVSATVRCLVTREEIREKSVEELDAILDEMFSFDHFAWQRENGIEINEPFRADGLNRILYRCKACGTEGETEGKGAEFVCRHCGKSYTLDPLGRLVSGDEVHHIPDWYAWQREVIRQEIEDGSYRLDTEVDIAMLVDHKAIYRVGKGRLLHTADGFVLDGCEGMLHYAQSPLASYSLYSDYFWYELGDVICIGTNDCLYYCFPKQRDVVARARIAAEEIYAFKCRKKRSAREERMDKHGEKALV